MLSRRPLGLIGLALLTSAGCWSPLGELLEQHIEPGGAMTAAIDDGASVTAVGIADGAADPMTVSASTSQLVIGLVVGDDEVSRGAGKPLLLQGKAVQMVVSPTSRAQLSVHIAGRSCAARMATVTLRPDGKGHLDGEFSGSGDGCRLSGSLIGVPIRQ